MGRWEGERWWRRANIEEDEQDLLAAGLMSGVEHEDEEMIAETAEQGMSATSMRRLLTQQLGDEVFAKAHARLRNVAQEDDDDALVKDIQQILGAERLDMLPMILKLIFQEEQLH